MADGSSNARAAFLELKAKLSSISGDENCSHTLASLQKELFGGDAVLMSPPEFAFEAQTKQVLLGTLYSEICEILLALAAQPWFSIFSKRDSDGVFNSFFMLGQPKTVFVALTATLDRTKFRYFIKHRPSSNGGQFAELGKCTIEIIFVV